MEGLVAFLFFALALSVAHVFAGAADTPPLWLWAAKIPTCSKAHGMRDPAEMHCVS